MSVTEVLAELSARRKALVEQIAEIDAVYSRFNSGASPRSSSAAAATPAAKPRRKRGRYAETADALILSMLKGGAMTTSEINSRWKTTRSGTADNTLTSLTKRGAIQREKVQGRGSRYSLA